MSGLKIVSHPDYRAGKYTFAGTRLWVAAIKRSALVYSRQQMHHDFPDVTDEMIDAALAFDFPPLSDEPQLEIEWDFVDVRCRCFEQADVVRDPEGEYLEHRCGACGKRWRLTVTFQAVAAPEPSSA